MYNTSYTIYIDRSIPLTSCWLGVYLFVIGIDFVFCDCACRIRFIALASNLLHWQATRWVIYLILMEMAKPLGFSPPQSYSYRLVWWWFSSATWPLGPPPSATWDVCHCGIRRITLNSTFLWHVSVTITWQVDKNFHTLPWQHYSLSHAVQ